ncbi:hypothetical protein EBU94_00280 [bacterium]|nr:hypothetical protein [bacterium]
MNSQEKQRRLKEQIQNTTMSQTNHDSGRVSISNRLLLIIFGIIGLLLMNVGIWYTQIIVFTKFNVAPFTFYETMIIYFTLVFNYWILTKPIQTKD